MIKTWTTSLATPLLVLLCLSVSGPVRAQTPADIVALRVAQAAPLNLLGALGAAKSDWLSLTGVSGEMGALTITGLARSNRDVSRFLKALEASGRFDHLYLKTISTEKVNDLKLKAFILQARFLLPETVQYTPDAAPFVEHSAILSAIQDVAEEARKAGLSVERFQPRPEVAIALGVEVPILVEFTGPSAALLAFLETGAGSAAALSWRQMEISILDRGAAVSEVRFKAEGVLMHRAAEAGSTTPAGPASTAPTGPLFPQQEDAVWADPFESFIFELAQTIAKKRAVLGRTPPLQRYGLDELTLVGLDCVAGHAVVEDPKGKRHSVAPGDLMGKNWGQVTGFQCPGLVVTEEPRTTQGDVIRTEQHVEMAGPFGELDPER